MPLGAAGGDTSIRGTKAGVEAVVPLDACARKPLVQQRPLLRGEAAEFRGHSGILRGPAAHLGQPGSHRAGRLIVPLQE
jgi:hypothetical protein